MTNASGPPKITAPGSKELEREVERLRHAIELAPWDLQARFLLAEALERLGSLEEAVEALKEVIRRDPNNLPARVAIHRLRGGRGGREHG